MIDASSAGLLQSQSPPMVRAKTYGWLTETELEAKYPQFMPLYKDGSAWAQPHSWFQRLKANGIVATRREQRGTVQPWKNGAKNPREGRPIMRLVYNEEQFVRWCQARAKYEAAVAALKMENAGD